MTILKIQQEPLKVKAERALIDLLKTSEGNKLETERELAKILGISRSTLREALGELTKKGYLTKRMGSGSFIMKSAIDTPMRIDLSVDFSTLIMNAGHVPANEQTYLGRDLPDEPMQEMLGLEDGEYVQNYSWDFYADDVIGVRVIAQIPDKLFIKQPGSVRVEGREEIMKMNIFSTYCEQETAHTVISFRATQNDEIAKLFEIDKDTCIIYWHEKYYNIYDEIIGCGDVYFNPEVMKMNMVAPFQNQE